MKQRKDIIGTYTCLRCGATIEKRVPHPKQCSECKSPNWKTPRKVRLKYD